MQIIGLTKAAAFTILTFTLSTTPVWSQTNQNSLKETPILYSQSRSNRDLATIHFNRGNAYEKQEKWNLALVEYQKAIKLNPDYALAYFKLGFVLHNLGDINNARLNYNIAKHLYKRQGNTFLYDLINDVLRDF
ncbi:tetratricopeptide repeat protein [Anabaenopsis elenkinii]|uniref:Tetratricopeptide repeat protein n=1 Tax=Anabaenopsis elenkinii CCIBt3563 TaxID=2779889 RepID=A0A7S6U4R4_9CYAN|nr:tetratricopeptide repeat protein [Anabaenopsis elenkinii]QOV23446.1 tetratricopeptide repeat protein [Anabaenopsis elenkinii CCIBt3563]